MSSPAIRKTGKKEVTNSEEGKAPTVAAAEFKREIRDVTAEGRG